MDADSVPADKQVLMEAARMIRMVAIGDERVMHARSLSHAECVMGDGWFALLAAILHDDMSVSEALKLTCVTSS